MEANPPKRIGEGRGREGMGGVRRSVARLRRVQWRAGRPVQRVLHRAGPHHVLQHENICPATMALITDEPLTESTAGRLSHDKNSARSRVAFGGSTRARDNA